MSQIARPTRPLSAAQQEDARVFNATETTRTFNGFCPLRGERTIYDHFNPPELDGNLEAKYAPARLLGSFVETDEAAYWYFLEILPPRTMQGGAFTMSEASTLDIRFAFFKIGDRYFGAYVRDHPDNGHHWRKVQAFIAANLPPEA